MSSGSAEKVYTVFGYMSAPSFGERKWRDEGFLAFFEPTATSPREAAEKAISLGCETMSIHLTGGENHFERVVELVEKEVALRRSVLGNRAPLVPEGEKTVWVVIGSTHPRGSGTGKSGYQRIFTNENSTAPGEDIERAIGLGATNIGLEVKEWKRGKAYGGMP